MPHLLEWVLFSSTEHNHSRKTGFVFFTNFQSGGAVVEADDKEQKKVSAGMTNSGRTVTLHLQFILSYSLVIFTIFNQPVVKNGPVNPFALEVRDTHFWDLQTCILWDLQTWILKLPYFFSIIIQ